MCVRGYQKTTCENQLSPSNMWVPVTKLSLAGLLESTCRAISVAHSVGGNGHTYKVKQKVPDSLIPKSASNFQF